MSKFLKMFKYVLSLGYFLWRDYQIEKSKTKVLVSNVNQLLTVAKNIRAVYDKKGIEEVVKGGLDPDNLKSMLVAYQVSRGLYYEIKKDVKYSKKAKEIR